MYYYYDTIEKDEHPPIPCYKVWEDVTDLMRDIDFVRSMSIEDYETFNLLHKIKHNPDVSLAVLNVKNPNLYVSYFCKMRLRGKRNCF